MSASGDWRVASSECGPTSTQRKPRNSRAGLAFLAALCVFGTVGCAQFQHFQSIIPNLVGEDVSKLRAERKQALVDEYEHKRNTAIYQAAVARWDQGDARGCEESLKLLLGRAPDNRDGHLLYSEVCLQRQDFAAAREHIEAVLAQKPDDAEALHAMGTVLDIAGQRDEAIDFYGQAAELEPDNEVYAATFQEISEQPVTSDELLNANEGTGRDPGAALISAAQTRPVAELLRQVSQAIATGQSDLACQLVRQSTAREPQNERILQQAALLAIASRQDAIAVAVLADSHSGRTSPMSQRLLGVAHYRCGNYSASKAALEAALAADSSDPLAHFLLGHTLRQLGQQPAAEREFALAHQLDPSLR